MTPIRDHAEGGGPRALRILLAANDGFSAGHVARAVAISRGLARCATQRGIELRMVLATTSEAHALLESEPLVVVRLPPPLTARRGGFSDSERRRIVRGTLEGLAESFGPDLLVTDTFPSGPHGELAGLAAGMVGGRAKRALVRRSVPEERANDELLIAGLRDYHLAIIADDPGPSLAGPRLPIRAVRVPPITMSEARDGKTRREARDELGLPPDGRAVLVAAGGGGDEDAMQRAAALAETIARVAPDVLPVVALGPLAPLAHLAPLAALEPPARLARGLGAALGSGAVRVIRTTPLQPLLAAFDGAFAAAGYNTAHELAKAGLPAALFAQPRPFDDQAARAVRFAEASLALLLDRFDDDSIAKALAWMMTAPRPSLEAGGADRAAEALLDLATGTTTATATATGTATRATEAGA